MDFRKDIEPQNSEERQEKKDILKTYIHFLRVEKEFVIILKAKNIQ